MFKDFLSKGKSAVARFMTPQDDANQVKQVNPNEYIPLPIVSREDCLVLYGPRVNKRDGSQTFDIVVNSEQTHISFSLYRSASVEEAKDRFRQFEHKIPVLLGLEKSLCSASSLQSLCDTIRRNPSFTLGHLAILFDLKNVLSHNDIKCHLNDCDVKGLSPIMLAVQKENLFMVQMLMGLKVKVDNVDFGGNSVFHLAATTNKEIIEALKGAPELLINQNNSEGHTPLHLACLKDKPECVKGLLCLGADVNVAGSLDKEYPIHTAMGSKNPRCAKEILEMYPKQLHTQDIKHGGTPLHWATSRELIEALIELGCNVNAKNFKGDTALQTMVLRERCDCVVALLARGSDVDAKDDDGNTALHLAIKVGNLLIVKALLAFEAATTLINDDGFTPWDYAVKMTESGIFDSFQKDRTGVLYALHAVGAYGSEHPVDKDGKEFDFEKYKKSTIYKRQRSPFDSMLDALAKKTKEPSDKLSGRCLSLDGGGVKGLVLTRMLLSMENVFGVPANDCFDWIIGTSTGGMIALALADGLTVFECQTMYMRFKDKVFVGSRPYSEAPFETFLKDVFGVKRTMSEIKKPKVSVTATLADRIPPDIHIFRNYRAPQDTLGITCYEHPELGRSASPNDQYLWKAARASGAAPSFFRPEGPFVDGGVLSNNPSVTLLTEISEYNLAMKASSKEDQMFTPTAFVSLGTGIPQIRKTKVVDIFRPDNAGDTLKLFMGWDGMGKLMLESMLDADGTAVDQARAWCTGLGVSFHRFSPYLLETTELDETDDKVLVELLWHTMAYMHSRRDDLVAMAPLFVPNWKPRERTVEPLALSASAKAKRKQISFNKDDEAVEMNLE